MSFFETLITSNLVLMLENYKFQFRKMNLNVTYGGGIKEIYARIPEWKPKAIQNDTF